MIRRSKFDFFGCIAIAVGAAMLSPGTALAQDGEYGSHGGSGFSLGIGGVVGVKPKYEGSDEYEAFGFPIVFPKFGGDGLGGRISVRGADDVRLRAFDAGGFEIGPLAGYAFGRDEDDGDLLRGLGDVDEGLVLGAYLAYSAGPFLLDVSYHHIATGDDNGYLIRFGGGLEKELRRGFVGTLRVGATFADDSYQDSYFGISQAQSLNSRAGLTRYDADAGIKDVHLELGAVVELSERWKVRASGKYTRLLGDAADSPIVESEDQFSALIGASYTFDISR